MMKNRIINAICLLVTVVLSGCAGMPDVAQLDVECKSFVNSVIERQIPHWNAARLKEAMPGVKQEDLVAIIKRYRAGLGPIESMSAVERTTFRAQAGVNVPDYIGSYTSKIRCSKGSGTVHVVAVHKDGKWSLTNFSVDAPAMLTSDKECDQFIDKVAQGTFRKWKIEDLDQYASDKFKKELQQSALPMKAVFAAVHQLGPMKTYDGAEIVGNSQFEGTALYNYRCKATFEKGSATMMLVAGKQADGWKLSGLNVQSGR